MEISYRELAPADSSFAPGAFDSQIGKDVPCRHGGVRTGTARLVGAKVDKDGGSVLLTVDIPEGAAVALG